MLQKRNSTPFTLGFLSPPLHKAAPMFYIELLLWIARGGGPMSIQPTDLPPVPVEPSPRTIHDVEADLRIQAVVLGYERARHTVSDTHPDVIRLDQLIDEWQTMRSRMAPPAFA
jgi:hypothetical protein